MNHSVASRHRFGVVVFVAAVQACGSPALPAGHLVHAANPVNAGFTDCGASSDAIDVTIGNDAADSVVKWSADVDGPFVLDGPATGTLASFEKATVVLHAAVPSTAAAGLPVTGSLRFHTNDPNEPVVTIPLTVTPRGATLIMPSSPVEFGDIPVSATSPSVVGSIRNLGNAPAEIVVGTPSDPQFAAQAKTLFVLPGAKEDVAMTFSPTTWAVIDASLPVTVKGPVCGALPPMALRGRGTKGVVLTSPGSLDFGLVNCGATAGPKKVTVENKGDAPFDVDAALAKGTSFTVAPTKATVAVGASIELTVTPNAIPKVSAVTPDLYADTLTLTTDALGDFPHVIALHETAQGAIFTLTIPQTPIRSRVDDVKLVPVTLTNTGNFSGTAWLASPNNALRITGAGVLAGQTSTPNLEVRADPEKLGVDDPEPLTWSTTLPTCGTNVVSGTVHGYDSAIEAGFFGLDQCVIGRTHRLYCWGPNDGDRLPLAPGTKVSTPKLVTGELPDEVAVSYRRTDMRTGSLLKQLFNGYTFLKTLPQVFDSVVYSRGFDYFHWCALTTGGGLSCVGATDSGQWANGDCYDEADTPIVAYPSIAPVQAYAADEHWSYVIRNGEVWKNDADLVIDSNGCTVGQPKRVVGISDAVSVGTGYGRSCALLSTGQVTCWNPWQNDPPQLVAGINDGVRLVANGYLSCVVRGNGLVRCWNDYLSASDVAGVVAPKRIFPNGGSVCIIGQDDSVACSLQGAPFQRLVGFEGP